jgi:nitrate reductase (NAD(P)H)
VKRKYTPISRIDRVGSFVLLLKIYRPTPQFPDGGKMSCFLADLPHNSQISISYPFGRFIYLGRCNTQITSLEYALGDI